MYSISIVRNLLQVRKKKLACVDDDDNSNEEISNWDISPWVYNMKYDGKDQFSSYIPYAPSLHIQAKLLYEP